MTCRTAGEGQGDLHLLNDESAQELLDNLPCGVLITLVDGTVVSVSQTFLDWTGFDRECLVGRIKFQDILTVPGRIFYETHLRPLLLMHGAVNEIACHVGLKEREPLPILLNSNLRRDASGQPAAIRMVVFRATERTRYEHELRQARNAADQYAALVEASSDAIITLSLAGIVQTWNPGACALFGYQPGESVGRSVLELIFSPEQRLELSSLHARLHQGEAQTYETARRRKDGSLVHVSASLSPIIDQDGEVTSISVIYRDITERRKAEAEIAENARFIETLLNAVPASIYLFDAQASTNELVNSHAGGMLGYSSEEWTAVRQNAAALMHPDDRRRLPDHLAGLASQSTAQPLSFEHRMRHKDGSWRTFLSRDIVYERGPDGAMVRVLGAALDVTEWKETEVRLQASQERLAAALRAGPLGVHEYNPGTGEIVWDETVRRLWGVTSDEPITYGTFVAGVHPTTWRTSRPRWRPPWTPMAIAATWPNTASSAGTA